MALNCLGEGNLRITEEKRAPEKGKVLEGEESRGRKPCFTRKTLAVYRIQIYIKKKKIPVCYEYRYLFS